MDTSKLEAGRETDALVARHVMEWCDVTVNSFHSGETICTTPTQDRAVVPYFSSRIEHAFQVVQKVKSLYQCTFQLEDLQFDGKRWQAMFKGDFDDAESRWMQLEYAFADTPELAICKAALKFVEVNND